MYPGENVLLARIGGTLPATVLFEEVLGAKTLFFSFSTADELLHAPERIPARGPVAAKACAPGRACSACSRPASTG